MNYLDNALNINTFAQPTGAINNSTKSFSSTINTPQKDSFAFTEMGTKAEFNLELSTNSYGVVDGVTNGQAIMLKRVMIDNKKTYTEYYDGTIGNKEVSMSLENTKSDINPSQIIQGTYNGKEVNLRIDAKNTNSKFKLIQYFQSKSDVFKEINITGTLNGQEVNLKYPKGKVPQDPDLKDLISFCTNDLGICLLVRKDEIINVACDSGRATKNYEDVQKIKNKPGEIINKIMTVVNVFSMIFNAYSLFSGKKAPTQVK